jgi:hypothetical protein
MYEKYILNDIEIVKIVITYSNGTAKVDEKELREKDIKTSFFKKEFSDLS